MDFPPQRLVDFNNLHPNFSYDESQLHALVTYLDNLTSFQIPPGDLSIVFMTDSELANIHDEFMQDPTTTDVITFIGDPEMNFAGEICISIDHALTAAKEHSQSPQEEITLYLVHGWLHLGGFDDIEESDRQKMRAAEKIIMDQLRKENLIPNFILE